MTALSDKLTAGAERAIGYFGASITLTDPNPDYSGGTVVETPVDYTVTAAGPIEEAKRYSAEGADQRVTATFYVAASALTEEPAAGWRIVAHGRTWVVVLSVPLPPVNGVVVAYRLDVGEVGTEVGGG